MMGKKLMLYLRSNQFKRVTLKLVGLQIGAYYSTKLFSFRARVLFNNILGNHHS